MRPGVLVRLILGGALAPAIYLLFWNIAFIASLLAGLPQPWQLVALLMGAALAGLLAGLVMARIWRAGLLRAGWEYPRWLRLGIVYLWTGFGLAPPFFPFPGRPTCTIALILTLLASVALVWHHRRESHTNGQS